ncbi:HigA family addiction module antitoxin [Phenylobacterium sp.]|uniref:HigA family addiction module antitoxin n=1 Tax=Phenylobacterium sp. TaxID=1871053 RepID=UPI0028975F94|nr:HigA family addiction module antitoxin [Phenylobacterium sp.]
MTKSAPIHPGQHVRDVALTPKRMSVTDAAGLLGISRPGVSNFLNGKVSATPDMAARVERAFGIPAQNLLDMQAAYDTALAKSKGVAAASKAYVPPFLSFKANDIEAWAAPNVSARVRLSVFLRTLVHSTGVGLRSVDFPGNDDAMRPGWDGLVEAEDGTPWIPKGRSGWEFGVDKNVKSKADGDFAKSVTATPKADRDQMTFVFVTPRRWSGKAEWVKAMKASGQWQDVRAYDASDLEQWLEQSHPGQTWFANETNAPSEGVRSLDRCWSDFADVAKPPLSGMLFRPAIEASKRTMISRLKNTPDEPTIIAADSIEEALAFLAQLFSIEGGDELAAYRDRVLVFDKPGVLPRLAQGKPGFIAVTTDREVEREMGPLASTLHTIVIYPRNATNATPHVSITPLNDEAFRAGLEAMGLDRDEVSKCADESGRSLTVLRRRLSNVPAVRTPAWASDEAAASNLIPFLFVGVWDSRSEVDQLALTLVANGPTYEVLEKEVQRFAALNDPPIWSIGTYRGVISKIDALYACAGAVTREDLQRFFSLARMVLGEDDPALDLPQSERWAASIHGKTREFSGALRESLSETLVLLAVHGNHLFKARLGIDCEIEAVRLVRDLLTPLTTRTLEAAERDLPTYAEAAPDEFLSLLESDLKSDDPAVMGLMRPADAGMFGSCPRTGLLWALEGLAWSPVTLPRAALILARLSEVEINDNWGNKPINSLSSIFRAWMPQTAASHDERLAVMKLLAKRHPDVAWRICIEQIDTGQRTGDYSHKPRWRPDGYGFGEPFSTWKPVLDFMREMVEMALNWKSYTRQMLCDLVEHLHDLSDEDQARVWTLVSDWAAGAPDAEKALVRERIRVTVMSRRAARLKKNEGRPSLSAAAKAAYAALEPSDLLQKHEWLFREAWVEESADEIQSDDFDFKKRDERIAAQRVDALRQVLAAEGIDGVIRLAEMGRAASQIGWLLESRVFEEEALVSFIQRALPPEDHDEPWPRRNLVFGALRTQDDEKRERVLRQLGGALPQNSFVRVLLLAPFRRSTWRLVDELEEQSRNIYWSEVVPDWIHEADDEACEGVERLLAVERPRAAFACIHHKAEAVRPHLLQQLLSEVAKGGRDREGEYKLDQYHIQQAFVILDKASEVSLEEKARLEFAFIDALSRPWSRNEKHGIPNLEKYTENNPALFIQAIVWTYRRKDGGEDPPEWKVPADNGKHLAERGYKLLEAIRRIPGHDDLGELQADRLLKWVKVVRETCAELGRLEIADVCLGKLFAEAPEGADGIWPCEPVREVMEEIQTKELASGAHTGLYNARGAHWRGEGGSEERELAERYLRSARLLQYSHPFVAAVHSDMAKTYEHEASYHDTEADIRRRIR